ncbi:MAG TPA: DNA polymerase III subunit delta [Flavobacteriales bacterium]|nr:DNA polymerase III subunit delta [Flavobacteriales bacterium]
MFFSEVIGQETIKRSLIKSVKNNRVSHAQLFVGAEGSGSLAMAIAFAQYISCEDKREGDSCGKCPSCVKYMALAHPDLHFIFPVATNKEVPKNPRSDLFMKQWRTAVKDNPYMSLGQWHRYLGIENKQAIINVEDCNEIIKKLSLKTFESEYKVMIIWKAERLFHSAAPKLLKILEEPPPKTLFLLTTENSEQIIQTILSRTQIVRFKKLDYESLEAALSSKYNLEGDKLNYVVKTSVGNYTEALRLIDHSIIKEFNFIEFQKWMRMCFRKDVIKMMEWIDEIAKIGRERQKSFIEHALQMVRECLMINYGVGQLVVLTVEERKFANNFSPFVNQNNCIAMTEALNKAYFNIERNANIRILLLDLSILISEMLKKR